MAKINTITQNEMFQRSVVMLVKKGIRLRVLSLHVTPVPLYPVLHWQENEPLVLSHVALS